jgi:hypothetical protein
LNLEVNLEDDPYHDTTDIKYIEMCWKH